MAKVLHSQVSANSQAKAFFTFPSPVAELWLSFRMMFDAAALSDGNHIDVAVEIQGDGDTAEVVALDTTANKQIWTWWSGSPIGAAWTASTWRNVVVHVTAGTPMSTTISFDGVDIGAIDNSGHDVSQFENIIFGWDLVPGTATAASGVYFDDIKASALSLGGSELFNATFESATIVPPFDSQSVVVAGVLEVVDDPVPAGPDVETTLGVAIAFDDTPLEPDPTWTRIDDPAAINVVQRWSIDRGRTSELEKTGTGTATIELIDTTGRFDPTNATSSLYGKLNPMKQVSINLQNPVTDDWSCLFRGFIADWDFEYVDETEKYLRVTLECVDAFDLFASLEMAPGHAGNTVPAASSGDIYFDDDSGLDAVQTRINQALDDAGWDATLREVFTGNVGLQGTVYARNDGLLSVIQDAADAEFPGGVANAFMRKDGFAVFHGRFAKFNPTDPTYDINTWKAGDLAAFGSDSDTAVISKPYQFSRSRDKIINRALSLPMGVDEADVPGQVVSDATSITNYGVRSASFENLLTRNGDGPTTAVVETKLFGTYYVDNYADPRTRVDRLTFRPQPPDSVYGTATWALMCGVDISDRVHLKTTHTGGGGFNEYFFVEGVHYVSEPMSDEQHEVTLELDLSPAAYFDTNPF